MKPDLYDKWTRVGPSEIETRVPTFAFLPGKPGELIVGTRPEGFYKVNANDELWQKIDVDWQFALDIGPNPQSIAVSPHDHSLMFLGIEEHGILRSTDAGASWLYANSGLRGKETGSLNGVCFCFHPQEKRLVYYGSNGGLYRSGDAGQTWAYLQKGLPPLRRSARMGGRYDGAGVNQVGVHRAAPDRVYAGFFGVPPPAAAGMYVSNDAGDSWQPCSAGMPDGESDLGLSHKAVYDFAMSDTDPEVIFAGLCKGLFVTRDGGRSWHPCGPFETVVSAVCLHLI